MEQKWKLSLLAVIIIMGVFIFFNITSYLSGFLGAFTIYIMVRGQMRNLVEKRKMKKSIAATLILCEVLLIFIIPVSVIVWLLASKIQEINLDPQFIISQAQSLITSIYDKTGYNLLEPENLGKMTSKATILLQFAVDGISSFFINAMVMIFIVYFLLIGGKSMEDYCSDLLPFRQDIKKSILGETKTLIISNTIGIPLVAIVQGSVAYVGFWLFGLPNPLLLGILTSFATILPVVGATAVWLPAAVYLAIIGDWGNAIGIAIYGGVGISGSDNLVRFILQKKMANTHPLITIFGVIIGLSIFGFWGVIFGPLLLSMFFLCLDIYKREYIDKKQTTNITPNQKNTTTP